MSLERAEKLSAAAGFLLDEATVACDVARATGDVDDHDRWINLAFAADDLLRRAVWEVKI